MQRISVNPEVLTARRLPVCGSSDAAIKVVEFGDYECPACRTWTPAILDAVQRHPSTQLIFRNYPLKRHLLAREAAFLKEGVSALGSASRVHEALMAQADDLTAERLTALKLQFDPFNFLLTPLARFRVEEDITLAKSLGIRSIASVFVCVQGSVYRIRNAALLNDYLDVITIQPN